MAIEHLQINQMQKNDQYTRTIIYWLKVIGIGQIASIGIYLLMNI